MPGTPTTHFGVTRFLAVKKAPWKIDPSIWCPFDSIRPWLYSNLSWRDFCWTGPFQLRKLSLLIWIMSAMVCGKGWDKNKIKQAADAYNIDELMNLLLRKRVLFDVLVLVPFDQKSKGSRIQQPTLNFKQQKINMSPSLWLCWKPSIDCCGPHKSPRETTPHLKKKGHLLFLLRLWPHVLVQLKNSPRGELQDHSPT